MSWTVLVTGGAGSIGSHLCQAFIERGDRVVCLDTLSAGARSNIERLLNQENFTLRVQDNPAQRPRPAVHNR